MSIQGTYTSHIDLTVGGEPVNFDIEIDYEYFPGIQNIDPRCVVDESLTITRMELIVDDRGMPASVGPDYHEGIINQLNPAFENHLNDAWHEFVEQQAIDAAVEREERLDMASGY